MKPATTHDVWAAALYVVIALFPALFHHEGWTYLASALAVSVIIINCLKAKGLVK